jgi:hypothetical protein
MKFPASSAWQSIRSVVGRVQLWFSPQPGQPPSSAGERSCLRSIASWLGWLALAVLLVFVIDGPRIRWTQWQVLPNWNKNVLEALAWHQGRLDVPAYAVDLAVFQGRFYNVFPPMFTFLSFAAIGLHRLFGGGIGIWPWLFRLGLGLPVVLAAFWAACACTRKKSQAVVVMLLVLLATPMLPMLVGCLRGSNTEVNHTLSVVGMLLLAGDIFGRRRIWPSLIGFVVACWSRQLTLFYFPLIAWAVWQRRGRDRMRPAILSLATLAVALAVPAVLNALKFGSPFQDGYGFIYTGREDFLAERASHGLFHPRFLLENARYMLLQPPGITITASGVAPALDANGASILLTCPLLLAVFLTVRQWWRDPPRRLGMLLTIPVITLLLLYHNTGWVQKGFYRFGLDFVPIWLLVICPFLWGRWRTPVTCLCVIWSIWYFRFIT